MSDAVFFIRLRSLSNLASEVQEIKAEDGHRAFLACPAAAANWGRGNGSSAVVWRLETFSGLGIGDGQWGPPPLIPPEVVMPKLEIVSAEAVAIDTACMNLMETVRRGRQKQEAYVQEGDPDGAAFLEDGIAGLEQARLALRNLLERAGWTAEMIGHAYKEVAA
jgi:hypothetical protein